MPHGTNEAEDHHSNFYDARVNLNIVGKASGIPDSRIDAVLDGQPTTVSRRASDYERHPSGAVCLIDD